MGRGWRAFPTHQASYWKPWRRFTCPHRGTASISHFAARKAWKFWEEEGVFWVFVFCTGHVIVLSRMLNSCTLCIHLYSAFFLSCLELSDTRAILSVNNFQKELIINAENSKKEKKKKKPAFHTRTFNVNALRQSVCKPQSELQCNLSISFLST